MRVGRVFDHLSAAVTGRRGRLVTIVVWVVLGAGGFVLHGRLDQVTAAGQTSFLPAHSQSTRVVQLIKTGFHGGENIPLFVVFERRSGLTHADRVLIGQIGHRLGHLGLDGATPVFDSLTTTGRETVPGVGLVSPDRQAAIVALGIDASHRHAITNAVIRIRGLLHRLVPRGLSVHVTGPAGLATDLQKIADKAGTTLLLVTLVLVLVLLLAVYRAPVLAVLPLVVVGAAYFVVSGITYLLADSGVIKVDTEGTLLLLVLIFGAGTDYSLLLVHRYREALGAGKPLDRALRDAVRTSAPAIAASGATVIAAMLVLLLADLESTRWLGPVLALGIAVMLAASFTLMPALLSLLGTRAFWPTGIPSAPSSHGVWTRVAGLVRRRAAPVAVIIIGALLLAAAGNLISHGTIGFGQGQTSATDSSLGTAALERHFPDGLSAPLTAIVRKDAVARSIKRLNQLLDVRVALPVGQEPHGNLALIGVVLTGDPYAAAAGDEVKLVTRMLRSVDRTALVGGVPAINLDVQRTNARDTRVVVPAVLAVVLVILCVLLVAIAAPVYLIITVVLSFAATLGLITLAFTQLFGQDGLAFNLVLISFIFLVALGVDYNIFLMDRVRRESERIGTREGTLRALTATGSVVTGAGIILAGTFGALALLPLEPLVQIGTTVAIGVLLDTLIVRALLVPSLTYLAGGNAWWPAGRRAAVDQPQPRSAASP